MHTDGNHLHVSTSESSLELSILNFTFGYPTATFAAVLDDIWVDFLVRVNWIFAVHLGVDWSSIQINEGRMQRAK